MLRQARCLVVRDLRMATNRIVEISLGWGKVYVVEGKEKSVLVDTPGPGNGRRLVRALAKRGVHLDRISLILITHGHLDHFGTALYLRERTGVPVAIHELDADGLRTGRNVRLYPRNLFEKAFGLIVSRLKTNPFEPDILLKGEEGDLEEYGIAARWVRTPGHSPGSISVVIPGDAAIVGDLVIGKFGFGRKPAYPLWVRDGQQLKDSIRKLLDYGPTVLLSGHGGPLRPEDVRRVILRQ